MPYLPMVKAIAPNAPIGAAAIMIATSLNITSDNWFSPSRILVALVADHRQRDPEQDRGEQRLEDMPGGQRRQECVGDDVEQEAGQRRVVRLAGIVADLGRIERRRDRC